MFVLVNNTLISIYCKNDESYSILSKTKSKLKCLKCTKKVKSCQHIRGFNEYNANNGNYSPSVREQQIFKSISIGFTLSMEFHHTRRRCFL